MAEDVHRYLPELREYGFSSPERASHWFNAAPKVLGEISEGIASVDGDRTRGVSSVPSVWARPLLFKNALFAAGDEEHPLHTQALKEWKGMLSLLALHDKLGYDVEVVGVDFNRSRNVLTRALEALAPSPVELERGTPYLWTDVLLIRYKGIPLGALSPATLVYTASNYAGDLLEKKGGGFRLADDRGFLRAPHGLESEEEQRHLRDWLEKLSRRLPFYQGEERPAEVDKLNGLLRDWIEELPGDAESGQEGTRNTLDVAEEPMDVIGRREALDGYQVYRELLKPLKEPLSADARNHSDLVLATERNSSRHRDVVVITPELLSRDKKYRIWAGKTVVDLGGDAEAALRTHFNGASGDEQIAGWKKFSHNGNDAMWVRPERYFLTDVLIESEDGDLLADSNGGRRANFGTRFVPPFRKEILDFYSSSDVRNVLNPAWNIGQDSVTFAFELPLDNAEGADVRVEKTYRRSAPGDGEGTIKTIAAPVMEIFPNYVNPYWRKYYLFEGTPDRVHAEPVFQPLDPEESDTDAGGRQSGDGAAALANWKWAENDARRVSRRQSRRINGTERQVKLTEITGDRHAFPEGVVLSEESRSSRLRNATPEPYGLILIDRLEESFNPQGTLRVGVDLGTSNTNVYTRSGGSADALSIDFQGRHLRSITAGPAELRRLLLEEFFVPGTSVDFPVPTSLRIFETTQTDRLLLDYFIFFSIVYSYPDVVYTDIKWSGGRAKIRCYIESLLFLILVEALTKEKATDNPKETVEIAYSYPKSFSDDQKQKVQTVWKEARRSMMEGADRVFDQRAAQEERKGIEVVLREPQAEGRAAGEYFKSKATLDKYINSRDFSFSESDRLMNADRVAVCLDVGGGTTDFSIWNQGDPICDASILMAGNQIAEVFRSSPHIREALLPDEAVRALNEVQGDPGRFSARLNAAFTRQGAHVKQELGGKADSDALKWLRQMIAVEFAGLSFYTAYLLGGAAQQPGGAGLLDKVAQNGIKLYWGGNGARLINWIDYGKVRSDGHAAAMLQESLYVTLYDLGVEQQVDPTMVRSPRFKHEPAGGLVVMDLEAAKKNRTSQSKSRSTLTGGGANPGDQDAGAAQRFIELDVVSGEHIELRSGPLAPTDTMPDGRLFENGRTTFERTSLDRLERFVEIVNTLGVDRGLITADMQIQLSDDAKRHITGGVEEAFRTAESVQQTDRVIEPVFITEVKLLMDLLVNP